MDVDWFYTALKVTTIISSWTKGKNIGITEHELLYANMLDIVNIHY